MFDLERVKNARSPQSSLVQWFFLYFFLIFSFSFYFLFFFTAYINRIEGDCSQRFSSLSLSMFFFKVSSTRAGSLKKSGSRIKILTWDSAGRGEESERRWKKFKEKKKRGKKGEEHWINYNNKNANDRLTKPLALMICSISFWPKKKRFYFFFVCLNVCCLLMENENNDDINTISVFW